MDDSFKVEIISPEKIIFSDNTLMVKIPSYEGDMSLLKNHISIITFLRPGIIQIKKTEEKFENFFVQDGTIEYFNNNLVILTTSAINVKDISKEYVNDLVMDIEKKLENKDLNDHDRYILHHKLYTIKEVRV